MRVSLRQLAMASAHEVESGLGASSNALYGAK